MGQEHWINDSNEEIAVTQTVAGRPRTPFQIKKAAGTSQVQSAIDPKRQDQLCEDLSLLCWSTVLSGQFLLSCLADGSHFCWATALIPQYAS